MPRFPRPIVRNLGGTYTDTSDIAALLETSEFLRLQGVSQLGYAKIIAPTANHTRYVHSLATAHKYQKIIGNRNIHLNDYQKRNGLLQALLHDIGHGPFSHNIDRILKIDHKKRGIKIIDTELRPLLEAMGYSVDYLIESFSLPQYQLVGSTTGVDKLEYVERDNQGQGGARTNSIKALIPFLIYADDIGLCVSDAGLKPLRDYLHEFYALHERLYWERRVMTAESMLGRAMKAAVDADKIDPEELPKMSEADVERVLREYTPTEDIMRRLSGSLSDLYQRAIVFKIKGYGSIEEKDDDKPDVIEITEEQANSIPAERNGIEELYQLEREIQRMTDIDSVLISTTPGTERIKRNDIKVYDHESETAIPFSAIDNEYTDHLSRQPARIWVARVVVPREKLCDIRERKNDVVNAILRAA